jgi:GH35 family endo-1,4-beta-xylanase
MKIQSGTRAIPISKRELNLRYVNVFKSDRKRATRLLINELQNIGMPVEVGIDLQSHRFNLAFKLPNSGKRTSKLISKLFNFASVTHKFAVDFDEELERNVGKTD